MKNLSKRERVLIALAALFMTAFLGRRMPDRTGLDGYEEAKVKFQTAIMERQAAEGKIKALEELKATRDSYEDYYRIHRSDFSPVLENEDLQDVIVEYLERNHLELNRFVISDAARPVLDQDDQNTSDPGIIHIVEAEVQVVGAGGKLCDLLDDMAADPSVRIISCSMNVMEKGKADYVIDMKVEYYMLDQSAVLAAGSGTGKQMMRSYGHESGK